MTDLADGITGKVPDYAETRLAFRVWRVDRGRQALLSVNAGKSVPRSWMLPANALCTPEGEWTAGKVMVASCSVGKKHDSGVPDPGCSCGIYATTDLSVVNCYLSPEAPVLGVVELGGRTIPATHGYRAQAGRVAAILLVDPMFSLPHSDLRRLAAIYGVPALVPQYTGPKHYRSMLGVGGIDWDAEMRRLADGGAA